MQNGGFRWSAPDGEFRAYDARGRMLSFGGAKGHGGYAVYNKRGQFAALTDIRKEPQLIFRYWADGLLGAVTDRTGRTVLYRYRGGLLSAVTDVLGHTTRYVYNILDRLVRKTDALAGVTGYAYDSRGNLARITDAKGGATRFVYDKMDRLGHGVKP